MCIGGGTEGICTPCVQFRSLRWPYHAGSRLVSHWRLPPPWRAHPYPEKGAERQWGWEMYNACATTYYIKGERGLKSHPRGATVGVEGYIRVRDTPKSNDIIFSVAHNNIFILESIVNYYFCRILLDQLEAIIDYFPRRSALYYLIVTNTINISTIDNKSFGRNEMMKISNTWEASLKILARSAKRASAREICARGKKVPRGLFLQFQATAVTGTRWLTIWRRTTDCEPVIRHYRVTRCIYVRSVAAKISFSFFFFLDFTPDFYTKSQSHPSWENIQLYDNDV